MARQKETAAKSFILAAERHKYACEKLLNLRDLDNIKDGNIEPKPMQKSILADTFYLSGYIIECTCCSAIYSHYDLTFQDRKNINETLPNRDRHTYNVNFKSDAVNVFSVIGDGEHSLLHFANFSKFFADPKIPLLNGDISIFNACNNLFQHFRAEIRYITKEKGNSNNLIIHYKNVFAFYQVACDIFEQVRNHYKP